MLPCCYNMGVTKLDSLSKARFCAAVHQHAQKQRRVQLVVLTVQQWDHHWISLSDLQKKQLLNTVQFILFSTFGCSPRAAISQKGSVLLLTVTMDNQRRKPLEGYLYRLYCCPEFWFRTNCSWVLLVSVAEFRTTYWSRIYLFIYFIWL